MPRCSPAHPLRLPHRNRAALTSAAVSTAQLDNSGDEGEEQIGVVKDYSGSGLRISGIEGLCRIPGAARGLMTNITMKECLESASMWVACAAGCVCVMMIWLQVVQRSGQYVAAEGGRRAGDVHVELPGVELSQVILDPASLSCRIRHTTPQPHKHSQVPLIPRSRHQPVENGHRLSLLRCS